MAYYETNNSPGADINAILTFFFQLDTNVKMTSKRRFYTSDEMYYWSFA